MNIFLVPYTWLRHFHVALFTAGATTVAWALLLTWFVFVGPFWTDAWDGAIFMAAMAGVAAGASTLAEASLRRQHVAWLITRTALSTVISGGFAGLWYWGWTKISLNLLFSGSPDADDASLVSLRYRLGAFIICGMCTAVGPVIVRRGAGLMDHLLAGFVAGMGAAAVWHLLNFTVFYDLYLASGVAAVLWGGLFGLFAWGLPDELYTGWVRVLSNNRHGHRIPVDAMDRSPKERFVGHFPRGLDLWAPMEDGVLEMHLSVAVDADQNYKARGLSLHPTVVRRFLERIDIRYDPRRSAPLETRLSSGDRIVLGEGETTTTVEFIMLPREET